MAFVRSIGRWTMTALVINCIIGGGIFGVPGELTRLLGRASPIAMVIAALGMAVILACFAEVASQFSEPGGPYLYVRTAFGRFPGMQVGWFHLLADTLGVAALAALFVNYLTTFLPWLLNRWERAALMAMLIAIPGLANWVRAMVLLLFVISGSENAVIPSGEIREPRRTIPFGLAAGLLACAAVFMLLQFITVATIGTKI